MHHTPQKLLVCCPEVCTPMCHTRIDLITAGRTPVAQPFRPVICVLGLVPGRLAVGPGGAVRGQPGYSYAPPPAPLGIVCCLYFQLRRGENMFLVVMYPAEHRHHRGSSHSTALSGTARNHPAHLTGCRPSFTLFHLGLARPCGCCFRLRCLLTPHLPGIPSKTLGAP